MPTLRSVGWIDAPPRTVSGALRHTATAENGLVRRGIRAAAAPPAGELLVPGDELSFRFPWDHGHASVRTRIVRADADGMSSTLVAGQLAALRHESTLTDTDGRTLLTETVRWTTPLGPWGRVADFLVLRRFVRAVLAQRMRAVRVLGEAWAGRPVVVGAAIVHNGRLLGQRRDFPARDAGRWELPGGRVEAGEREQEAVVRECQEELAVEVVPTGRVGTDVPLHNGMLLRVYRAELLNPTATPRAVEHREVRWLGVDDLAGLDWLDADRLLVHSLCDLLRD